MVSKGLVLTVEGAENGTNDIPTFSLDELNRCRGQLLGGGAFGKVYAINGFPGLAVKEIWLNEQPDRLKEITKFELKTMSQFSHPGVLKYHQVLTKGEFFYVVMDRYDGDLQQFIADHRRTQKPIPRESMLSILKQLADALAYVHAPYKVNERGDVLPGIVHRDLKPANVLMSKNGERVAIADFGLCKDAQHDGNTFAGSPSYMAPEVFIHRKTSRASDVWALGVIIYELVTLELPRFSRKWEPEDAKEFFVPKWKPDLSAVKDEFTRTILEKIFVLDPEERPTAKELADRLRTLNTFAGEPGDQDPVPAEKHESQVTSDDSNSKVNSSWTPLMRAAAAGDIEMVRRHLSDKDKKNSDGDTALMIAARAGHEGIVELIDPTDKNEVTALMRAAGRGDVEAVRALIPLQKGQKTYNNDYKRGGRTALMMAAVCGRTEVVRLLVEHEGGLKDKDGWTALMYAAEYGHTECVQLLAEKEEGMQDKDSKTALMHAAENDHTEYVKLLLEKEAGIKDKDGRTALMLAAIYGNIECAKLLLEKEKGMKTTCEWNGCPLGSTALILAAQCRREEVVRLLMKHEDGVSSWTSLIYAAYLGDIDAVKNNLHEKGRKDISGMTALMWAAQKGHKGAVKVLLEHEKEITDKQGRASLYYALKRGYIDLAKTIMLHEDPTDENGVTALMRAAARGDAEMVKLLIPIQKEMRDNDGNTALVFAARAGHADIVELLDSTDEDGVTALMRAAEKGNVEAVRALIPLQKGKKMMGDTHINGLRISSGTALMMAATRGHAEVVKLLVEHEGGMKDSFGKTALMVTAQGGCAECIKLLLNKETGMQNIWGSTALMLAAHNMHPECVELLMESEGSISEWTELMYAAYRGDVDSVKNNLHMKGARDIGGWTALMRAAAQGHEQVVELLTEERGMTNNSHQTALMWAARNGHPGCVRLLLEKEGGMLDKYGGTALMFAVAQDHIECIKLLLEKEAGMRDKNGWTALMRAVLVGHTECVRLLAEEEKDMKTIRERFGYLPGTTALNIAKREGRTKIASVLSG
ncbi:Protein kinase NEK family protein [Giardia duodenalis]|uniref:Protein kinase NEK family protein n=1 Tax=Giardia intestinalis TaxID=5741 RepID=V6TZN9_GIAIN|nr:Protein kinase NEK family protein [Giardia intestinalis]